MNKVWSFHLDGKHVAVRNGADGRLWFSAETICSALQYSDSQAALLYHCDPGGILFGNEQSPQAMIDLRNVLQLTHHSPPSRATRLYDWLCRIVLRSQLDHSAKPQRHKLATKDHHLQLLHWQDDWWLSMQDAVKLFGNGEDPVEIAERTTAS